MRLNKLNSKQLMFYRINIKVIFLVVSAKSARTTILLGSFGQRRSR